MSTLIQVKSNVGNVPPVAVESDDQVGLALMSITLNFVAGLKIIWRVINFFCTVAILDDMFFGFWRKWEMNIWMSAYVDSCDQLGIATLVGSNDKALQYIRDNFDADEKNWWKYPILQYVKTTNGEPAYKMSPSGKPMIVELTDTELKRVDVVPKLIPGSYSLKVTKQNCAEKVGAEKVDVDDMKNWTDAQKAAYIKKVEKRVTDSIKKNIYDSLGIEFTNTL